MLSRVIAKNVGDVFFETQCISMQPVVGQRRDGFWLHEVIFKDTQFDT